MKWTRGLVGRLLVVLLDVLMVFTMGPWSQVQTAYADEAAVADIPATSEATTGTPSASSEDATTPAAASTSDDAAVVESPITAEDPVDSQTSEGISVQSTVDESDMYSITVDYVDASTGDKVCASHEEVLQAGSAWSVDSPSVDGYVLADDTQSTMGGTAAGSDHHLTYTVRYSALSVSYTVVHMKQVNGSTAYYTADTETLTADAGATVNVTPKSYPGYKCVTSDLSLAVTSDGKAVKTVRYDLDPVCYAIWFTTDGSTVDPIIETVGSAVTAPATPTRAGYTFVGWDTDGDGVADSLPATMPDHNIEADAVWSPSSVSYTVVYWTQNKQDNSKYDLANMSTATGTSGDSLPTTPAALDTSKTGLYKWYSFSHADTGTIASDGSTVQNVYYDLDEITVNAYVRVGATDTLVGTTKVKYGSQFDFTDFSSRATSEYEQQTSTTDALLYRWHPLYLDNGALYAAGRVVTIDDANCALDYDNKKFGVYATFAGDGYSAEYRYYYYQDLDGNYSDDPSRVFTGSFKSAGDGNGVTPPAGFTLDQWRVSSTHFDGTNYATAIGSVSWATEPANWQDTGHFYTFDYDSNLGEHRFARKKYEVRYLSGGNEVASAEHYYEASFSVADDLSGKSITAPIAGYQFVGWYDNASFVGSPVSEGKTPLGGTVLYAKWAPSTATVTFDSDGGTDVAAETVDVGSSASKPANPSKASGATFL
ncbi:MAG: InlB B-repeat-containing protein [Atopobiaceae bacterium]|jgi:uncharacterized repeat protein (TIGR02543 family)|nr:InlB B-repeat-containing protein [Atopobiaceae bacterium]MCI2172962.1 InlB B-repeat-containing protein [Atopobiaceae bacterium]MCI2208367.1 InlB B-repeat-containing protein [Atopobiaceae bacterium]